MFNMLSVVGDIDYVRGPYTVNVPAGDTEVTFSVSIYADNVYEDAEYFTVIITGTSKPGSIFPGREREKRAIVTILDNDREYLTVIIYISCRKFN